MVPKSNELSFGGEIFRKRQWITRVENWLKIFTLEFVINLRGLNFRPSGSAFSRWDMLQRSPSLSLGLQGHSVSLHHLFHSRHTLTSCYVGGQNTLILFRRIFTWIGLASNFSPSIVYQDVLKTNTMYDVDLLRWGWAFLPPSNVQLLPGILLGQKSSRYRERTVRQFHSSPWQIF